MRRGAVAVFVLCGLLAAGLPVGELPAAAVTGDVEPYRGLGAWIDSFDYAPRLQTDGKPPPVTADSADDVARLGARTLYLQVANPDGAPADQLTDAQQIGDILGRAKAAGLRVVAWYVPYLVDVAFDTQMIKTIVSFRSGTARFDTVALDLEYTQDEPDLDRRNDNTVALAKATRKLVGTKRGIGAIVYPAVQTEVLNPILWPNFPYRRLAESIDVWMPMAYYTFRSDPYRDPFRYTDESVSRLRKRLGDDNALVHPIGGIADETTTEDYLAFMRAVRSTRSIGWSVYDFHTTASSAWPFLRGQNAAA